jgi:hypothetical protein
VRQWLFGEFAAVSRLFGFEQFETPVLEAEALFTRKAGDEITQQLYNFEARAPGAPAASAARRRAQRRELHVVHGQGGRRSHAAALRLLGAALGAAVESAACRQSGLPPAYMRELQAASCGQQGHAGAEVHLLLAKCANLGLDGVQACTAHRWKVNAEATEVAWKAHNQREASACRPDAWAHRAGARVRVPVQPLCILLCVAALVRRARFTPCRPACSAPRRAAAQDKGGRRVALRPELTPSLARLVLAQARASPARGPVLASSSPLDLTAHRPATKCFQYPNPKCTPLRATEQAGRAALPLKWFTIGQCWRYERTTRGRRREHYQWCGRPAAPRAAPRGAAAARGAAASCGAVRAPRVCPRPPGVASATA